ncbi:DNA-3-methyladenine glycosylase 2 family protein [Phytomonospora endophytica]|uniref:AraC family transcriptional regulator of adaptative response / DNA-3-methyladenine glycosylase II n=1 Tax=Phytomonospora endophytica TaxID=714109 RepID=A0A841FIU3_9ACTN|nr:AlkA N-terminal domain-containing protein [Phytomonospora endophytica]MBB6035794.1 AraC family transcriptional regulator of adaptative response / DNA-3-methyladenine glycosylase II [Phytomonospora endophytica]GIG69535.1 DNA-3-methyladenine glycosylase [Phytomonospora endophytica]
MTGDSRYEAVRSRDARFDGEFFFAVSTTGIYCRPSCPATTPKRQNVRFFPSAAAAQSDGFRACRRCRPDAAPGSAAWNNRADVVGRAVRLIGDGVVDREGVAGLASRLGYSARQVQRQLNAELGAGPVALARAQRAHTARVLLQTTGLQTGRVAFAAGFSSIRQFNDTIREIYASTPSELRASHSAAGQPSSGVPGGGVPLRLAFRGEYATAEMFDFLAAHAVPGVEEVTGPRGRRVYRRTLRLPLGAGVVEVAEKAGRSWLDSRFHLDELRDLTTAAHRLRRLLDLDADPYAIAERLAADPVLAPVAVARPGLRAPGAADPAELAVRAVLGEADGAARDTAAALAAVYGDALAVPKGGLTHLFPEPAVLATAPLTEVDAEHRPVVVALAAALASGEVRLDAGADRDQAEAELLAIPGIDARTAAYIRMRALGDPDIWPEGPAELSPWRTYAALHTGLIARSESRR